MLPEAFVFIQLAHLQRQQRMLRPMAGTVMEWHRIELLGTAAILSGYKGTYAVPMDPLTCVVLSGLSTGVAKNGRLAQHPALNLDGEVRVQRIILLHSPLVGPASLVPTANALEARGYPCLVPSPRSRGKDPRWRNWPAALLAEIGDVEAGIIVGHSMAGLLAAHLAGDLRAAGMICLDANMPPESGPTPPVAPSFRPIIGKLPVNDGYLPPWHEWWRSDAFEGAPISPELRASVIAEIPRLRLDWFDDEFEMPDWSSTKRAFIRTGSWFDEEADKAAARGWPVIRLEGTHLHATTCPEETASAIVQCVGLMDTAADLKI